MPTDFGIFHVSEMDIENRIILGALCLFFVILLRNRAISGIGTWQGTRKPVGPSLQESPSPWDAISNGVEGCVVFFVAGFFMVVALIVAINLFFPATDIALHAVNFAEAVLQGMFGVVKSIAKALLA